MTKVDCLFAAGKPISGTLASSSWFRQATSCGPAVMLCQWVVCCPDKFGVNILMVVTVLSSLQFNIESRDEFTCEVAKSTTVVLEHVLLEYFGQLWPALSHVIFICIVVNLHVYGDVKWMPLFFYSLSRTCDVVFVYGSPVVPVSWPFALTGAPDASTWALVMCCCYMKCHSSTRSISYFWIFQQFAQFL